MKSVDLKFTGALSLLNYDEYIINSNTSGGMWDFSTPGTWQSRWPPGFSIPALKTLMSTLLYNVCLIDGGFVCINALENYIVSDV